MNGKRKKGKIYNNKGQVISILNILDNGINKVYSLNGKLMFEGEYLNGKRNGKGKEYNFNNNLKYDGEYLNDLRNGKGKEYDAKGNLIFEGKYLNGEKITLNKIV